MVELENVYITLKDGRSLSARVWLPDDTDSTPVPAILEFLPYRKRDGTAPRDESTYPVFARAGYAGISVSWRTGLPAFRGKRPAWQPDLFQGV